MISDTHTRYESQLSRHGKLRACRSYHCRRSSGKFPCDDCKMNSRERFLAMPNPVSQTDFVSSLCPTGVHAQSPRRQSPVSHNAPRKPSDAHRTRKADTPPWLVTQRGKRAWLIEHRELLHKQFSLARGHLRASSTAIPFHAIGSRSSQTRPVIAGRCRGPRRIPPDAVLRERPRAWLDLAGRSGKAEC